jgi:hypothetical protein
MSDKPPWGEWFAVGDAVPARDPAKVWHCVLGYVLPAEAKAYDDSLMSTIRGFHDSVQRAAEPEPEFAQAVADLCAAAADIERRLDALDLDTGTTH